MRRGVENCLLGRAAAAAARAAFAALAAHDQLVDAGQTNEQVHNSFNLHPLTQEHVHEVPVCAVAYQPSQTDETPVQGADDNKDAGKTADGTLTTRHREMWGNNTSTITIISGIDCKIFPCTKGNLYDEIAFCAHFLNNSATQANMRCSAVFFEG